MSDYKNIPNIKVMNGMWSQNLQLSLRNGLKSHSKINGISGSSQTILLCIVGELAGRGSPAVAVGVSDM